MRLIKLLPIETLTSHFAAGRIPVTMHDYPGSDFFAVVFALVLILSSGNAIAQSDKIPSNVAEEKAVEELTLPARKIPYVAAPYARALGDRLSVKGKERIVYSGTLADGRESTSAQITYELPGQVRIERTGKAPLVSKGAAFGSAFGKEVSTDDNALVAMFLNDSPDTFIVQLAQGSAFRVLGYRFENRRDPGTPSKGPYSDIIELDSRIVVGKNVKNQLKRYFLDSTTGLLSRVEYRAEIGGKTVQVQTRYTGWKDVGGQKVPDGVEYLEDSVIRFTFKASSVASAAKIADGLFN